MRLGFIDITKAIAIISMVSLHVELGAGTIVSPSTLQSYASNQQYIFLVWFMPVFFVITGYCSNYSKPFRPFLFDLILTIGFPIFFFDVLYINVTNFLTMPVSEAVNQIPMTLLRFFRYSFWFLRALFVAKLLFWIMIRFVRIKFLMVGVLMILYLVASIAVLFGHGQHGCHSLIAVSFIATGYYVRNNNLMEKKNFCLVSIILYLFIIVILYLLNYDLPIMVNTIQIKNYLDIPLLYILSVSGSIGLMAICKKISHNTILEYIGKYSLVIYCFHFIVHSLPFSTVLSHDSSLQFCLGYIAIHTAITIGLCCLLAYLVDRKYLRVVIGKRP